VNRIESAAAISAINPLELTELSSPVLCVCATDVFAAAAALAEAANRQGMGQAAKAAVRAAAQAFTVSHLSVAMPAPRETVGSMVAERMSVNALATLATPVEGDISMLDLMYH
jgi:hypothetical protein